MKRVLLWAIFFWTGVVLLMADLPFRQHRADLFQSLPVDTGSIVFIGNSLTNMNEWAEAFADTRIVGRGIVGATSDEILSNLGYYVSGHPRKVFLMMGINDLATLGKNYANYPVGNIQTAVQLIRRLSPETEIYVQSVLPTAQTTSFSPIQIIEVNRLLADYCSKQHVNYIDLWSQLVEPGTVYLRPSFTLEGVHLTAAAYAQWCHAVEPYVGRKCELVVDTLLRSQGLKGMVGERTDGFSALPLTDGDILMVGDENVAGGEWHELLHSAKMKNRGTGWGYMGADLTTLIRQVPSIFRRKADSCRLGGICVEAGMADLFYWASPSAVFKRYRSLLDSLRHYAPETPLWVQAVLPTNDALLNASQIVPFNDSLKTLNDSARHITFVDTYTPFEKEGIFNQHYYIGNYLNGAGYHRWAELLLPYLADSTNRMWVVSADSAQYVTDSLETRIKLGRQITQFLQLKTGNEVGQYPVDSVAHLRALVDSANVELNLSDTLTKDSCLRELTTAIDSAFTQLLPSIVYPRTSSLDSLFSYTISTPLQYNLYMTSHGRGQLLYGEAATSTNSQKWKFVERKDSSWDVMSGADSLFLCVDSTARISLDTISPKTGWQLRPSLQPGFFVMTNDSVQLYQTDQTQSYELAGKQGEVNATDSPFLFSLQQMVEAADSDTTQVEPILTLTNLQFKGGQPYRVPDEWAARVLAAKTLTTVVDFTTSELPQEPMCLVGSCAEADSCSYFAIETCDSDVLGVGYADSTTTERIFAQSGANLAERCQLVVVAQPDIPEYQYYINGQLRRRVSGLRANGYRLFGNVPHVSALYLGGLVVNGDSVVFPFSGILHSVRFYDTCFTAQQVAELTYQQIISTGTSELPSPASFTASKTNDPPIVVYDLRGRRLSVNRLPASGVFLLRKGGKTYKIIR